MLEYLHIENLALLKIIDLEFEKGFTIISGETGAGKSVLLAALQLLAGGRAEKSIIRQGSQYCTVEAALYLTDTHASTINHLLSTLNLPFCEENKLLLKRTLYKEKGAKITINNALATLSNLKTLGEEWIDFHNPNEPQKLFNPNYQREYLDLFAGSSSLLHAYKKVFDLWKKQGKELAFLQNQEKLSETQLDYYQYQLDKISQIDLSEEAIATLETNFNLVTKAEEIGTLCQAIKNSLENTTSGVLPLFQGILKSLSKLEPFHKQVPQLASRIRSLIVESEDISSEIKAMAASSQFDPSEAALIRKNMQSWLEILRQYGPTLETVLAKKEKMEKKLASQLNIEHTIETLKANLKKCEQELLKAANALTQRRNENANSLTCEVNALLKCLGFQKASISIDIVPAKTFTEHGNCDIIFKFSSNAGQQPIELSKIASSGEIARIMLALKAVLANIDQTPILVFDEIDANVGGEIGKKVGALMAKLSKTHQVFSITHLPQVAAQAHTHIVITKNQTENETYVAIQTLSQKEERIKELARMLGNRQSSAALNHAEELLLADQ